MNLESLFDKAGQWSYTFKAWDFDIIDHVKLLGNTIEKENQGLPGYAYFGIGFYPACSIHGAMNKVTVRGNGNLWRCLN